jgi:hypothetical protein
MNKNELPKLPWKFLWEWDQEWGSNVVPEVCLFEPDDCTRRVVGVVISIEEALEFLSLRENKKMTDPKLSSKYVWPCGATNLDTVWIGMDLYYADPNTPAHEHTEDNPYWHHRYFPKFNGFWDAGIWIYCPKCQKHFEKEEE